MNWGRIGAAIWIAGCSGAMAAPSPGLVDAEDAGAVAALALQAAPGDGADTIAAAEALGLGDPAAIVVAGVAAGATLSLVLASTLLNQHCTRRLFSLLPHAADEPPAISSAAAAEQHPLSADEAASSATVATARARARAAAQSAATVSAAAPTRREQARAPRG